MVELTAEDKSTRLQLAFDATAEIEGITVLLKEVLSTDLDSLPIRALVRRVHELNSVIMSVVGGEDDRDFSEMKSVVHD